MIASEYLAKIHSKSEISDSEVILSETLTESNCLFIRETVSDILLASLITLLISQKRIPTLSILSRYAGPIPLPVVPTTLSAESYSLWNGKITEALSLMNNRLPSGLSSVREYHLSSSSSRTQGSITIPSPSTKLHSIEVTPEGI